MGVDAARTIKVAAPSASAAPAEIMVYPGIEPAELRAVVERVFLRKGVVGLVDTRDGSVLSLSVISQAPDLLSAPLYRVLYATQRRDSERAVNKSFTAGEKESAHYAHDDAQGVWLEQTRALIVITSMEDRGELGPETSDALRALVSSRNEQVIQAARAYLQEGNVDRFKEQLQHIAQSQNVSKESQPPANGTTLQRAGNENAQSAGATRECVDNGVDGGNEDKAIVVDEDESTDTEKDDPEDDAASGTSSDSGGIYEPHDKTLTYQVVMALNKRNLVSNAEALTIRRLVDLENQLILAAIQVYEERGDEEDFADTLRRIAEYFSIERVIVNLLQQSYVNREEARVLLSAFRDPKSIVTRAWMAYCQHGNQRVLADQLLTVLICYDKPRFFRRMKERGIFNDTEVKSLLELHAKEDSALVAIFSCLLSEGDLPDTLDSLKRLCEIRALEATHGPTNLGRPRKRSSSQDILQLLQALFQSHALTDIQYLVVRSLALKQDQRINAAYQTYTESLNLAAFVRDLKRTALQATAEEAKDQQAVVPNKDQGRSDGSAESEEDEDDDDDEYDDEYDEGDDDENNDDDDDDDDDDEFDVDVDQVDDELEANDEEEEEVDTFDIHNGIASQASNPSNGQHPGVEQVENEAAQAKTTAQTSQNLTQQEGDLSETIEHDKDVLNSLYFFVKAEHLTAEEASILAELVPDRDPRLWAAFDVYGIERDLSDLIDTLRCIAESIQSQDTGSRDAAAAKAVVAEVNGGINDVFSLDGSNETITDDDYDSLSDNAEIELES